MHITTNIDKSKHMKQIILLIFLSLLVSSLQAQPKKFGKVSKDDLLQHFSKADSSFHAVVLFDYGTYEAQDDFKYLFVRHKRIKILTDTGVEHATFGIEYNSESYKQYIEKIEAFTFNISQKGKVEKKKLQKDSIFEEDELGGWKTKKFTMPDVREGSIIDLRYELLLGSEGQLPNWYFDSNLPVKWSELEAEIPTFQRFNLVSRLNKPLIKNERDQSEISFQFRVSDIDRGYSSGSTKKLRIRSPADKFVWAMKDLPALEYVPFVHSIYNYRSNIQFDFKGIEIPNYNIYQDYSNTWESVTKTLLKQDEYGGQLNSEAWSRQAANAIVAEAKSNIEKVELIVKYINAFSWTEFYGFYADKDLEEVWNDRSGSSAELNLLLIKLLKETLIPTDPVLISTRPNGRLSKKFVQPGQFNKTIASVLIDRKRYFFDAVNEFDNYLLPQSNLNGAGLIVDSTNVQWVDLKADVRSSMKFKVDGAIEEEGRVSGQLSIEAKGYEALRFKETEEGIIEDYMTEYLSSDLHIVELDSLEVEPYLFFSPQVELKSDFQMETQQVRTGDTDLLYVQLPGFDFIEIEDLNNDERTLPVEFSFPATYSLEFRLSLPEGYILDELPEKETVKIPGKSFTYSDSFLDLGDRVVLERRFNGVEITFPAQDYEMIRSVFSAVKAPTKTIVLRKQ